MCSEIIDKVQTMNLCVSLNNASFGTLLVQVGELLKTVWQFNGNLILVSKTTNDIFSRKSLLIN